MINFDKISFLYKGAKEKSLDNISLHIPKGQCVLLCGLSGCGKTTLTRLVNGLIPYFFEGELTGKTTVHGIDTAKVDISRLSDIVGTVFQKESAAFNIKGIKSASINFKNLFIKTPKKLCVRLFS